MDSEALPAGRTLGLIVGLRAALRDRWASRHAQTEPFLLGVTVALFGVGAAQFLSWSWKRRSRKARRRNLSLLHHLDLTATSHNSGTRRTGPAGVLVGGVGGGGALGSSGGAGGASDDRQSAVFQIVLTGGPCAGKSSSMEHFQQKLRAHGFDVYLVPEVPTLLQNGGCVYPGLDGSDRLIAFETSLIELQLQMEQSFYNIAKSTNRPSVIIYDRGLLDVAAYLPPDLWEAVLNHNQWLRDGFLGVIERYDLILHLVTAADGAEKFYSTDLRKETLHEAKILDRKIRACWRGHPHHRIVDNSTDFDGKLERATKHLLELVLNQRLL